MRLLGGSPELGYKTMQTESRVSLVLKGAAG